MDSDFVCSCNGRSGVSSFRNHWLHIRTNPGNSAIRLGFVWKKGCGFRKRPDDFHVIKSDLASSGLVKEKNIERVSVEQRSSLNEALLIVFACRDDKRSTSKRLLSERTLRCGLVVYCPDGPSALTREEMPEINAAPFATVCNFRGRLINDILLMMLSTSFKKSDLK